MPEGRQADTTGHTITCNGSVGCISVVEVRAELSLPECEAMTTPLNSYTPIGIIGF